MYGIDTFGNHPNKLEHYMAISIPSSKTVKSCYSVDSLGGVIKPGQSEQ